MKGLIHRMAIAAILILALTLIFWQSGLFITHPYAVQKLVLLCVCVVCTLLAVPLIAQRLSAPASIGVSTVTALFNISCIIIACLKSNVFWVPVIAASAIYLILLFSFALFKIPD